MELISVIVPIYNVEKYMRNCIDSIINQTYKNLEIILVDDGSTDNSGKISDEYKNKDKRIKVLHKKNGGLSDARNKGLELSTGEYVLFIDSDDYIDRRMIEILYNNMKETNADISICKFKIIRDNKDFKQEDKIENKIEVYNRDSVFANFFNEKSLETIVAWNKLYKKEIFDDIRYPYGKIHEDEYVIHHLLYRSKIIVYTTAELYFYIKRDGSITSKKSNKRIMDKMEAYGDRVNFYKEKDMIEYYKNFAYWYCWLCREQKYLLNKDSNYKMYKQKLNKNFNQVYINLKRYFRHDKKKYIKLSMYKYCYPMIRTFRKLIKEY